MKHLIGALIGAAIPVSAAAWDFTPVPICTLTTTAEQVKVAVTYDPGTGQYAIALTLASGTWGASPGFSIAFIGPRSARIGTDRHQLSDGGATLTVTDSGFGNVLDGLEYNNSFVAVTEQTAMDVPLATAAKPVAAFRACGAAALS